MALFKISVQLFTDCYKWTDMDRPCPELLIPTIAPWNPGSSLYWTWIITLHLQVPPQKVFGPSWHPPQSHLLRKYLEV